jgi:hypothetical protein
MSAPHGGLVPPNHRFLATGLGILTNLLLFLLSTEKRHALQ